MSKKGYEVKVRGIPVEISSDLVSPLEVPTLVAMVERKMKDIADETGKFDVFELAILTAMDYAAQMYLKGQSDGSKKRDDTGKLDELILKIQGALSGELPK